MNSVGLNPATFFPPPAKEDANPMNGLELAANLSAIGADAEALNTVQSQQYCDLPLDLQFLMRIL